MKILLTGGTGLVGKELGKSLIDKGHEVVVVTRDTESSAYHCPYPHTAISWNFAAHTNELQQINGVIHLAGENVGDHRWTERYKNKILQSREQTTQSLVSAINEYGNNVSVFISTSAVGYYGSSDNIVCEDAPRGEGFLPDVCQKWEAPIKNDLKKTIRSVIFRVGVVLSEKGGALEKMVTPIQAGVGGALGRGEQYLSWVDIDDLVSMYVYAVDNKINGIYNAVAPNAVQNKHLMKLIAQHLNCSLLMPVPEFALRIAIGEMANTLLQTQRVSAEKIKREGFNFKYLEINKCIEARIPQLKSYERRKIYELWIPKSKEQVFKFFSDEKNLEKITPAWLSFHIIGKSTEQIEQGTLIDYKLKIQGVPVRWRTKITSWHPPHSFSDAQLKGPYKKWHHVHTFQSLGGGTLMSDQVNFSLPLGPVGLLAAGHKVQNDINKIFKHRNKQIRALL